ncbi:hypothetical protein I4U23_004643 [Adineta vaga]|nr:hypothetical protein I4U23_004643 [Adineta vaga]
MSYNQAPPPYSGEPHTNTQGPQPYPNHPPYMNPYPYGGGGSPVIIMQQQQQQQHQVIVRPSGTNHAVCCLICILTGGLSIPCWIYGCITD